MRISTEVKKLECSLEELWNKAWRHQPDLAENLDDVRINFRGESKIKPRFRIPSADNHGDLFFDSLELLRRFATMITPVQSRFLASVRIVMQANEVRVVEIAVPWSKTKERVIRISAAIGPDGPLDFELV